MLTGDRLLRREDLECSRISTMAERPTSVQQEADDVYQLLDSDQVEKDFSVWKGTRKHRSMHVSYVRNGEEFVS